MGGALRKSAFVLSAFIGGHNTSEKYYMKPHITYMPPDERDFDLLTGRVLAAVFEVSNTLGSGFLEKVYERALLRELGLCNIRATAPASFTVRYKSHSVGETLPTFLSKTCW